MNNAERFVEQARELTVMHTRLNEILDDCISSDTDLAAHRQAIVAAKSALTRVRIGAQSQAIKHLSADNRQLTMNL